MKIQSINNNYNNLSYKAICLNNKELVESKKLLLDLTNTSSENLANSIKVKLLNIFDKYLKKEAYNKCKSYQIKDDLLQEIYLHFFELVNKVSNNLVHPDNFIELVNKFKNSKYTKKNGVENLSIDIAMNDKNKTYSEYIVEKDLPVYKSTKNEKEKNVIRKKVLKVINSVDLKKQELDILNEKSKGLSIHKIADKMNLSKTNVHRTYLRGIAKIQDKNGILPKDYDDFVEILVKKCGDKKLEKKFRDFLLKNYYIMIKDRETLLHNIENSPKLLGITEIEFIKASFRQAQILYQKPETLNKNIEDFVKLVGISKSNYIKAALEQPSLFYQDPKTMKDKIEKNSKIYNISEQEYINLALKQPQLFYINPENSKQKIDDISKALNIKNSDVINLIKVNPAMICHKTDEVIKKLNLYKIYNCCKKTPLDILVYYTNSEKTLYNNILLHLLKKHYGYFHVNRENLFERIKENPDEIYNFNLPKNDYVNNFIEYAENVFKENLGYSKANYIIKEM